MPALGQTLVISILVGVVLAGLYSLCQIPLNRRRYRAKQHNESAEFNVFTRTLNFLQDYKPNRTPAEDKEREVRRRSLVAEIKDRMRIYESKRELDELKKKNDNKGESDE